MKKLYIQLFLFLIIQILLVFVHLFLIQFLPFPYNRINLLLIFLMLYSIVSIRPQSLWLILPLVWFSELFSSYFFGINALAILLILFVYNFLLITVLSNRSLPTVFLSSILLVFFYRLLILVAIKTVSFFFDVDTLNLDTEWLINLFWEIVFTTFFTTIIYYTLSKFLKRLRPEYINALQREYGSTKKYFH